MSEVEDKDLNETNEEIEENTNQNQSQNLTQEEEEENGSFNCFNQI